MKHQTPKDPKDGQTVDSFSLGQRIRHARAAQDLTLRDIASHAGVSYGTVQRLENGEVTVQLDIVLRVLNVLRINLKDFLAADFQPQKDESIDELVSRIKAEGKIPDLLSAIAKQWPAPPVKRSRKDSK